MKPLTANVQATNQTVTVIDCVYLSKINISLYLVSFKNKKEQIFDEDELKDIR